MAIPIVLSALFIEGKIQYSEAYYFNKIYQNWNKTLFTTVTTDSCKNITEQLIQDFWAGTKAGCNCFTYIKNTTCGKRSTCKGIAAINPIPISIWRGSRLCRETSSYWANKTYFDLMIEK